MARLWLVLGGLATAAALLLKGPIGLVLPVAVVAACAAGRQIGRFARLSGESGAVVPQWPLTSLAWPIVLALSLSVPWFAYATAATGGAFAEEFFVRHNIERGLGGDEQLDGHDHAIWFYGVRAAVDLLPWGVLLPVAAVVLVRRRDQRGDAEAYFGGVWFLAMLLFLSAMRYKRPDYLLPAYPGAAILVGCTFERWLRQWQPNTARWARRLIAVAILACAVGWVVYTSAVLPRIEPERSLRPFAEAVRRFAPRPGQVLLFRVDSHALAFHLGRPAERLWEWENLDIWACQPVTLYVVMPRSWAAQWPRYLEAGQLEPVLSTDDLAGGRHEQSLVLLRTMPGH